MTISLVSIMKTSIKPVAIWLVGLALTAGLSTQRLRQMMSTLVTVSTLVTMPAPGWMCERSA